MAIKVHGDCNVLSTDAMRVLACLYEKELDYEYVPVDMEAGDHIKEPFLSLNPFGQVPALEDGDLVLFDSRAINRYIAEAYEDKGTPLIFNYKKKMAIANVWIEVEAQKYDPPASKLAYELGLKPLMEMQTNAAVVEQLEPELAKVLDIYDTRLAQSKYLGGERFSLADLNHLPTMNLLMGTRVRELFDSRPHVSAWCNEILVRPAWRKVVVMMNNP